MRPPLGRMGSYTLVRPTDSQAVAAGLAKLAQAGIEEAAAPKIES